MTAAPVLTLTSAERASLGPVERAALAIGTALIAWSRHAARRAAARSASRCVASDIERERHVLRRAAARDVETIEANRDLGADRIWR